MRKTDINRRYRSMAIYLLSQGRKAGKRVVSWEELKERFGINWETYAHELHIKGIINSTLGGVYLTPRYMDGSRTELMEEIIKIYPYIRG